PSGARNLTEHDWLISENHIRGTDILSVGKVGGSPAELHSAGETPVVPTGWKRVPRSEWNLPYTAHCMLDHVADCLTGLTILRARRSEAARLEHFPFC